MGLSASKKTMCGYWPDNIVVFEVRVIYGAEDNGTEEGPYGCGQYRWSSLHQIISFMLSCKTSPICASQIAGTDSSSPIAGPVPLLRDKCFFSQGMKSTSTQAGCSSSPSEVTARHITKTVSVGSDSKQADLSPSFFHHENIPSQTLIAILLQLCHKELEQNYQHPYQIQQLHLDPLTVNLEQTNASLYSG